MRHPRTLVHTCHPSQDTPRLNSGESAVELNDIELRIDSADAWPEEVKAELAVDDYFGPVLLILSGTLPADMKELPPNEAKTWRKAHACAIKYSLDDGLLYRGMTSGNR
jgi:hypothetical protein